MHEGLVAAAETPAAAPHFSAHLSHVIKITFPPSKRVRLFAVAFPSP